MIDFRQKKSCQAILCFGHGVAWGHHLIAGPACGSFFVHAVIDVRRCTTEYYYHRLLYPRDSENMYLASFGVSARSRYSPNIDVYFAFVGVLVLMHLVQ